MKKITLILSVFIGSYLSAQTFSDNFDSYTAGEKLAAQSGGAWTTWSNAPGGDEDGTVSSANSLSGSNSMYFSSTVSGGGPVDQVRNFGILNTGSFSMSMNMFVETGKAAYFNFQKTATIGQTWSLNANFNDDATLSIDDAATENLATTYPQNTWFNFRIDINFNTNLWEVFIDNNFMGSFSNSINQIASIDIFPVDQNTPFSSGFYVDDFEYTVTPYVLPAINAAASLVSIQGPYLAGASVGRKVKVRNLGSSAINSFDLTLNYDGIDFTQSVTGLNLASLAETEVTITAPITLLAGTSVLTATVSNVNGGVDGDAADDVITLTLNPIVPAAGKVVVGEEGTGTWCGWCPRGAVAMDKMAATYGDKWIGIAVHNGDPMTVANYDAGIGALIAGYPSSLVDRGNEIDPGVMEGDFLQRITVAPTGLINNSATFLPFSRQLTVTVSSDFQANATSAFKLACVLVEDDVRGTTPGYNQSNYYAGGSNGVMGGYETKPGTVPAAQMVYDHVARAIAPSFGGMTNSFPAVVNSGETHSQNFTFTLPADWNTDNMHIVGLLIDGNGKIDNAGKIDFSAVTVDYEFYMQCPADTALTFTNIGNNLLPNFATNLAGGSSCAMGSVSSTQSPAAGSAMTNGVNTVTINSTDGCGGVYSCSFDVMFNNNVSLIEKDGNSIKFYPNPTDDVLNFTVSSSEIVNVKITSIEGKQVLSSSVKASSGQISTSNLSKGVYTIEFTLLNGTIVSNRFIKK
jgi:hypothetical protein